MSSAINDYIKANLEEVMVKGKTKQLLKPEAVKQLNRVQTAIAPTKVKNVTKSNYKDRIRYIGKKLTTFLKDDDIKEMFSETDIKRLKSLYDTKQSETLSSMDAGRATEMMEEIQKMDEREARTAKNKEIEKAAEERNSKGMMNAEYESQRAEHSKYAMERVKEARAKKKEKETDDYKKKQKELHEEAGEKYHDELLAKSQKKADAIAEKFKKDVAAQNALVPKQLHKAYGVEIKDLARPTMQTRFGEKTQYLDDLDRVAIKESVDKETRGNSVVIKNRAKRQTVAKEDIHYGEIHNREPEVAAHDGKQNAIEVKKSNYVKPTYNPESRESKFNHFLKQQGLLK